MYNTSLLIFFLKYSLQHIATAIGASAPASDARIDTLLIDSRQLSNPSASLFFALDGPRRNGHLFIPELYKNGVRHFVVSKPMNATLYPDAVFLQVPDVLKALQQLAVQHRSTFAYEVIGITGSNGKTVVKEWLYHLLQADMSIVRSPKSYNSQIGVPLSVWPMTDQHQLAIFEAGISQPGEMERLERIVQPTIGILTNIGTAHAAGFSSDAEKLREKLLLFRHSKIIIANGDDAHITAALTASTARLFLWGTKEKNTLQVIHTYKQPLSTTIHLLYKNAPLTFDIPFTDNASIQNAITCCAALLCLKVNANLIAERMKTLRPVNMRLEFKKGINNCIVINDSYSADFNSLLIALDFLQQQGPQYAKTVILSDFAEATQTGKPFYETLLQQLRHYPIHRLIGIGPQMAQWAAAVAPDVNSRLQCEWFLSTDEFISHFPSLRFKEEAILVKGGRVFEFEKIVALLQQKQHQTILEINLDAIAYNLKQFQQLLHPCTKIMVMVKAFAYGSGGAEVASVLQYHKADYLGVAYADEGVELRRAGITLPIMVMNPEESAFDAITENHLEPDLYSFTVLHAFEKHLQQSGLTHYPVHIEIETGMNRLGFSIHDMAALGKKLQNNPYLKVQSIFSHLVASEDAAEDAFSLRQYTLLQQAATQLQQWLEYDCIKHIANSAAIQRWPQLQMDMVRLGIGLYGITTDNSALQLLPAATLKSTIAQIKKLSPGDTVSYNRRGLIQKEAIIATVRIGYADGYSRMLGNGVGHMLVHNQVAPVVGTVCMDMTMIDITNIPNVQEGDEVIVFGAALPIQSLARAIGTIPYEIMTSISQRVKRVYWRE